MILRYDNREHCLRSTGDPPGILCFAYPGGEPTFAIDYAYEPSVAPGVTTAKMHEDGIGPTSTAITTADAVAGCVGDDELRHLYGTACQALRDASPLLLGAQAFDALRATVDFVEDVARQVEERLS